MIAVMIAIIAVWAVYTIVTIILAIIFSDYEFPYVMGTIGMGFNVVLPTILRLLL